MGTITDKKISCFHCGETCTTNRVTAGDKLFCCEGCKMVYLLLDKKGLCDYYQFNEGPGINLRLPVRKEKFAFLDDEKTATKLISFHNEEETHVSFYLPQIHCSSCLYLLERLPQLDQGVFSSRVDFSAREAAIVFDHSRISLRQLAELLTSLGYEPYISLHDLGSSLPVVQKSMIYQLGIAGFCFANIMLLSFPEYLGLGVSERLFQRTFRTINLILSLPVLLYSAVPFYRSAWKSLRHKFLNIDAPIVLAILVTFTRSIYEVLSGTGAGYFDSMTGIVFFMLAGRALQNRTYRQLSFERDYTSYFPIAVTVLQREKELQQDKEITKALPDIRCGDELRIHHGELIPADGILTRGQALIDYSFVTGESIPVPKEIGEIVYAGGRQTGAAIEVLVVKEVAQSYLTQLWNRQDDAGSHPNNTSFVHILSRYFTYIVLIIAFTAALYWKFHDPGKIWNAVTAVLIIACPCALLLSSTFTNGNILRILGRNHFYLRNAQVIENIAATTHIVFDKTGTLTHTAQQELSYEGIPLTGEQFNSIATLAAQSNHPLSRALAKKLEKGQPCSLLGFREVAGMGVEGFVNGESIAIGSRLFVTGEVGRSNGSTMGSFGKDKNSPWQAGSSFGEESPGLPGTRIYISLEGRLMGYFNIFNRYRGGLTELVRQLRPAFRLSVLSGDNSSERPRLQELMGYGTSLLFSQTPMNKVHTIQKLQRQGEKVMMIGDGLNDAGALRQSDTGIALSEDCNNFTPASHAILESGQLPLLPAFIRLCRANRKIILGSFILSIVYNVIGLAFAVQGNLSPLIAAILMPSSSLSILLVTYGSSNMIAGKLKLT